VGGLQPDHNSFTLFLSWFGLFGVLAILHIPISHVPSPCTSSALAREKCLQTLSSLGGLLPLLLLLRRSNGANNNGSMEPESASPD